MKKIILTLLLFIIFIIIFNSDSIINNILLSFNICFNNLFPSLIPFMFISNIFIKYDLINEIAEIMKFITNKVFKLNKHASFAIIMGLISGTPSISKYLNDLYNNKLINNYDVEKCICFCHFINPIFILNSIGISFFNSKDSGIIILISHFLSSFIIGIFLRNKKFIEINSNNMKTNKKRNFIEILNESINSTASTLLLILGVITFCLIITSIIDNFFNIPNNFKFIYGILEITQGLKYLSLSNFNIQIKTIIACFLVSFGGFCIHIQVFSILENKKTRYLPYFCSRLIHGLLSAIIAIIIMM